MNNTLSNFKFNELLPSSVKDDPKFIAASKCLDKLFEGFDDRVKSMLVYSRVDELTERELDDLAWQWNVGYYEGWPLLDTVEEKREFIKHAILIHMHKGTRWAIERASEMLNMALRVIEWWEPEGVAAEMPPYSFDVYIDSSAKGVKSVFYLGAQDMINNLKNVRSYLRKMHAMIAIVKDTYIGAIGQIVTATNVRPEDWRGAEIDLPMRTGAGGYSVITGQILPLLIKAPYIRGMLWWPEKRDHAEKAPMIEGHLFNPELAQDYCRIAPMMGGYLWKPEYGRRRANNAPMLDPSFTVAIDFDHQINNATEPQWRYSPNDPWRPFPIPTVFLKRGIDTIRFPQVRYKRCWCQSSELPLIAEWRCGENIHPVYFSPPPPVAHSNMVWRIHILLRGCPGNYLGVHSLDMGPSYRPPEYDYY